MKTWKFFAFSTAALAINLICQTSKVSAASNDNPAIKSRDANAIMQLKEKRVTQKQRIEAAKHKKQKAADTNAKSAPAIPPVAPTK